MSKEDKIKLFQDQFDVFINAAKEHIEDAFKLLIAETGEEGIKNQEVLDEIKLFKVKAEFYKNGIRNGQNMDMQRADLLHQQRYVSNFIEAHYQCP